MAAPGISDWQAQLLGRIQAPVTPQNLRAVNAWTQAEGGGATNNPFNTTLSMPGATSYNSVGVRNYGSPQQGILATADTLLNTGGGKTYAPLVAALRQGSNPMAVAQAIAASPWGTGSGVERVLGGSGTPTAQTLSASPTPTPSPSPAPASTRSTPASLLSANLSSLGPLAALSSLNPPSQAPNLGGSQPLSPINPSPFSNLGALQMLGALPGSLPTSAAPLGGAPSGSPPKIGQVKIGDPIPGKFQTSIGGEHPTEGLDGFPAHDYFANAGSPAVAPVSGTIVKLSGHNPADGPTEGPHGPFGYSVYVQGDNGRTYYLTHLGSRDVKVGETVKAGQPLGTVGNYAKYGTPSHIHMGVSAPGVTIG
jgi:murein DD-endopeptidase MepM/ murein hydrolase activator NlpD